MVARSLLLLTLFCSTFYVAESVTCSFTHYSTTNDWGYGCQLNNQSIESESDLLTIHGNHAAGFDDGQVMWIASANSKITFFPNRLVEHFQNLKRAAFHHSQMTTFGRPIPCGKLEYIGLDDNFLSHIPNGTFANCSQLQKLDLNRNNLRRICEHAFSALTKLSLLNLKQNKIHTIHPNAFSALANLQEIELNSNEIEVLDSNLFTNSTRLYRIRLDHNRISTLSENFFGNNMNFHVNLSSNHIVTVGATVFGAGKAIWGSIDLSNNLIEELPIFEKSIFLQELNLNNNKIRRITPGMFNDFVHLIELKLENNRIEKLQSKSFTGLIKLKFLYLNSNNISEIEPKTFHTFAFLYELWLSDNQLEHMYATSFDTSYSLRVLQVDRNKIKRIHGDLFDKLPNLAMLNLTENVCANESFFITWEERGIQRFPTFGKCRASLLVTLPISLLSFVLIASLTL